MSWYQRLLEKLKTVNLFKGMQALREERGAIFVLTALMLPVLLGCLGFAYDAGNLYMHKARLQNTADAAALAGGRAYVNALSEHASNGVVSSIPDDEKAEAKRTMKTNAEQYIRNNNPLFAEKTGKEEKFWFGTKSTAVGANTNSTEYFRVNLTEPVHLYFLPVIGIQDSMDVKAYATTKLTDTVVSSGGNNQQTDAENKPVVIVGRTFHDEINTNDIEHNIYNSYNVSTVYVKKGSKVSGIRTSDGRYVVPSSEGTIIGHIENGVVIVEENGMSANARRYAEVVEIDYDMDSFGFAIKERFLKKYIDTLPANQQADMRILATNYINALKAWSSNKNTWEEEYKKEYNRLYNQYKDALNSDFEKANNIYLQLKYYIELYKPNMYVAEYGYNPENAYNQLIKPLWDSSDNHFTTDARFKELVTSNNLLYNFEQNLPKPDLDTWETNWNKYQEFGISQPPLLSEYVNDEVMNAYMSQFPALGSEPKLSDPAYNGLEYYMTFKGDRNKVVNLSTYDVSTYPSKYGLTENEHSYLHLSKAEYTANSAEDLNITVDGFYVNTSEGITEDTPYYLFIDPDLKVTSLTVTNCNRPLILCYLGTDDIHYQFGQHNVKGIFYSPYSGAHDDTIINGSFQGGNFSGSIISDYLRMQGHNNTFQYNPDEVQKWQDSSEGLPATPNVGFTGSGGSGNSGGSTNTTTLTDRLRLFLAGDSNQNNYYNSADIDWKDI